MNIADRAGVERVRRCSIGLTKLVIIIIIIIMIKSKRAAPQKPTVGASNTSVPRYQSGMISAGLDGIPIPRYAPALARRLQLVCASLHAEALAGSGIVMLEFATLRIVAELPGIEQWRLADAIGIDRNSAGLISEGLARRGLLDRRVNGADRRARKLYLTPEGQATFKHLLPKIRIANERTLAPLSPREQQTFIDLFVKLIEGNRAYARPGAGRRKRSSDAAEKET